MALTALVVYALFALLQHGEVMLGLIERSESNWLTLFNLSGGLGFYTLVRSEWSLRLSDEPSLTMPQMVFAIVSTTWSYSITGPARGAVIAIMILVIMFGMFILQPRQARTLALLAVVLLGATMLWRAHRSPLRYPPRVEAVHFLFTLIVLGGTSSLAIRLNKLRSRLAAQKNELTDALALNRELATRDALTGLLNRRAMVELLAREHPRIVRGQGPLAVALLDIDWFKRVNDSHGHQAGDEVLKMLAGILRSEARRTDVACRYGGEEFVLLLPKMNIESARARAERWRQMFAEMDVPVESGQLRCTLSVGIAVFPEHGNSAEDLLRNGDRALYLAKALGRNRVVTYDMGRREDAQTQIR